MKMCFYAEKSERLHECPHLVPARRGGLAGRGGLGPPRPGRWPGEGIWPPPYLRALVFGRGPPAPARAADG